MSDDVMLIGVLRMPWDTQGDMTLMQVQARCRQAADKIEALERDLARLTAENEALRKRLKWCYDGSMNHLVQPLYSFEEWQAHIDAAIKERS